MASGGGGIYGSGHSLTGGTNAKYIGTSASFPIACAGKFYRCRKDALTATTQTAAQILPADFSSVGSRFS